MQASIVISSDEVCDKVEEVADKCPTLRNRIVLNNKDERRGWQSFSRLMAEASPSLSSFEPTLASDTMLLFFTSGTTGNPKMVRHTHSKHILLFDEIELIFFDRLSIGALHNSLLCAGLEAG